MESSSVFHRLLDKTYPTAVKGDGVYLVTSEGRRIFDGSSGAAVSMLGHGNEEVIEALCSQARDMAFAHTSFFTSDPTEELARTIIQHSKDAFSRVMFLSSGSEAIESALKLARQYHVYNEQPERVNIIGRLHSYHGNTLGALAAGNNPMRRGIFAPILGPTFHHVNRCFYQKDGAGICEQDYEDRLLAEWEAKFTELGPDSVAAVIVEPVGGATLGAVEATSTYLPRLVELCRRYGAISIFDEVMCGMGRCGTYHAWEQLGGVAPDLQTIGKGLAAGYQPVSAVLIGPKLYGAFSKHSRGAEAFVSGHTYQGHSVGAAAALMVQKILFRDGLIGKCKQLGEILHKTLESQLSVEVEDFKKYGGGLRGLGLFRAVDFGQLGMIYGGPLAADVCNKAFELGSAVYLCSSAVDAALFAPPFVMTEDQIVQLAEIFVQAVAVVLKSRKWSADGGAG
jgi:adenosylmethionine-8-amino-7-oxononanoate aminotransferase